MLYYRTLPPDVLAWLGEGYHTDLEWNCIAFPKYLVKREQTPTDNWFKGFKQLNFERMTEFEWSARIVATIESLADEDFEKLNAGTTEELSTQLLRKHLRYI
jgi:hypothetical protein